MKLETRAAAAHLRMAPGSLRNLRSAGRGPRYEKAEDGRCLYAAADLDAWLAAEPRRADRRARRTTGGLDPDQFVAALIAAGVTTVVLNGDRGTGKAWADVATAGEVAR